jgi:hypothetical protein
MNDKKLTHAMPHSNKLYANRPTLTMKDMKPYELVLLLCSLKHTMPTVLHPLKYTTQRKQLNI